jgi:hypothetical protein
MDIFSEPNSIVRDGFPASMKEMLKRWAVPRTRWVKECVVMKSPQRSTDWVLGLEIATITAAGPFTADVALAVANVQRRKLERWVGQGSVTLSVRAVIHEKIRQIQQWHGNSDSSSMAVRYWISMQPASPWAWSGFPFGYP